MKTPISGKEEGCNDLPDTTFNSEDGKSIYKVASADVARHFGKLRLLPDSQEIFVTHHGRVTHVLTTVNAYSAIKESNRKVDRSAFASQLIELARCLHFGVILIDYNLHIISINPAIEAWFDCKSTECVGRSVFEAIPTVCDSFVPTYVQRSIASKQPCFLDVPNMPTNGTWTGVQIYPLSTYVAILFADIGGDVRMNRLADVDKSLHEAVFAHDSISYIWLDAAGQIFETDQTIFDIVSLDKSRLHQVAFASLIPDDHRVAFEDALKLVLRGEGARTIDSAVLSNDGCDVPVKMAISELRGVFNPEGVLIILARR